MLLQDKADLLKVMANAQRLGMLTKMAAGEISVEFLARDIGLSQSARSQHLAKVRSAGLARARRDAQQVYYSVSSEKVAAILDLLDQLFDPKAAQPRILG